MNAARRDRRDIDRSVVTKDMGRMIVYATVHDDTCEVRPAEALDWTALAAYLREHLGPYARDRPRTREVGSLDLSPPMRVSQFPGGHSNLTYLLDFGGTELVVRRPPLGPLPPNAHDMAREFAWLSTLHPLFPLTPQPYLLCEDPAILGTTFYVMERRRGLVVRQEEPQEIAGNTTARLRASQAVVDALARLHAVDVRTGPLSALGKPAGFVARQVRGWTKRWERSQTENVPEMDAIASWLGARTPPDPDRPTVVHGDFKLDNVMLDPANVGQLVAVFDWEMSALGDPLVDLGILLAYWSPLDSSAAATPGAPAVHANPTDALTTVTGNRGWFNREEILARYMLRSGRDVSAIRFYEVFARFKIAVVIQQIFFRYRNGQTSDARFANFGERVTTLARQATRIAGD
jgi:aminoglycoside phosphotransferase (APT) family kinase protein